MDEASRLVVIPSLITILAVLLLLFLWWWAATINRFARLRNLVKESWANVDVSLKRRHDLIPNLVKVVERYAAHEKDLLERIVAARESLDEEQGDIKLVERGEAELTQLIVTVMARAEAYPELKSSEHFLELQKELANTEDRIAAARRFYNGNVRDYRIYIQSFPSSLLARSEREPEFFEIEFSERLPAAV